MRHLDEIDKSYFQHMLGAWKMAFWFAFGAVRLLIHGVLPNVDKDAGQKTVNHYFPQND